MANITKLFLFIISMVFVFHSSSATTFYRNRIPFSLTLSGNDVLDVKYNFSAQTGIHCTTNYPKTKIAVTYKGREKSAYLPKTLQNANVPAQANEVLADVSGKFRITTPAAENIQIKINCVYAKPE